MLNLKWVNNKVQIFFKKSFKNKDRNKIRHDRPGAAQDFSWAGPGRYGPRFLRAGPKIYNPGPYCRTIFWPLPSIAPYLVLYKHKYLVLKKHKQHIFSGRETDDKPIEILVKSELSSNPYLLQNYITTKLYFIFRMIFFVMK